MRLNELLELILKQDIITKLDIYNIIPNLDNERLELFEHNNSMEFEKYSFQKLRRVDTYIIAMEKLKLIESDKEKLGVWRVIAGKQFYLENKLFKELYFKDFVIFDFFDITKNSEIKALKIEKLKIIDKLSISFNNECNNDIEKIKSSVLSFIGKNKVLVHSIHYFKKSFKNTISSLNNLGVSDKQILNLFDLCVLYSTNSEAPSIFELGKEYGLEYQTGDDILTFLFKLYLKLFEKE